MSPIRLRVGSEYEWSTADPTLAAREVGVTTDTHRIKVGDGVTPWSSLPYADAQSAANVPLTAVTGDYDVLTDDVVVLATGTLTVSLPDAYEAPGRSVTVKNSGTGTVTVYTAYNGIDTEGASVALQPWESLSLVSDGADTWMVT